MWGVVLWALLVGSWCDREMIMLMWLRFVLEYSRTKSGNSLLQSVSYTAMYCRLWQRFSFTETCAYSSQTHLEDVIYLFCELFQYNNNLDIPSSQLEI